MPHIHTHTELSGILQAAGASPEVQMEFNRRVADRPHLVAWLAVPRAAQERILEERRAEANRGRKP